MAADDTQTGWVPRPDPTLLTTQALEREIEHLRREMELQIGSLGDACEAKFAYIEQRLTDRTLLVDAAFSASRDAVAAALASSKEAVAKSEGTFNKQLDEMKLTMAAANKGIEDQIGAVKERVTIIESLDRGAEKKGAGLSTAAALGISALAILIGIAGIVVAVVAAVSR
jgi:hypothetical protein